MAPSFGYRILILLGLVTLGWMILMEFHSTSYAAEPRQSSYTLNQVIDLAYRHNPVMNGAQATRRDNAWLRGIIRRFR